MSSILATAIVILSMSGVAVADESKPILRWSRPSSCPDPKSGDDFCALFVKTFGAAVAHPAMQRRLADVAFEVVEPATPEIPFISAHDPGGREAMRWVGRLDPSMLLDIMTVVEVATPHLVASHQAASAGQNAVAEREWALAALALGSESRGRALLEAMRTSASAENRELAEIWLGRLVRRRGVPMREDVIKQLTVEGSSPRVKFEAWMAMGDLLRDRGETAKAVEAYDRAVAIDVDAPYAVRNARTARQRAIDLLSPVAGLGSSESIIAGRRTVALREVGKGVAFVEYRLNGKLVATAERPPFIASIPFGRIPTRQVLEVATLDAGRKVIKRSSVTVNERSEAFQVEIVEPSDPMLSGTVKVSVKARVPRGSRVEQVVIEWNGQTAARFTAPPYATTIEVKPNELGTLHALLRLDDGSEVEDVLLVNSPNLSFEAQAHLAEVPAYFDGPVRAANVRVLEDKKRRQVERVITAAEAPLLIGVVIDSSESMTPFMLDVQEAAIRFVEKNLEERDRAMVVSFDFVPRVLLEATSDRARVTRSILSIRARGGTALYDAIIMSLARLQASGSRKALVVFSDGMDFNSTFTADDAIEVARRAGVPIYGLAFEGAFAHLSNLSRRTGGKSFEMRSLDDLPNLWQKIADDLRKQSLIIYRTASSGPEWRTLDVSVGGRAVRAPIGVYITSE